MNQNTALPITGAELIAAERARQVDVEGWTTGHDAQLGVPDLEAAAVSYAAWGSDAEPPACWPWARQSWKPKDHLRNLVRAGALFQAAADVADGVHAVRQLGLRDLVAALIDAALAAPGRPSRP